ncbi:site-2 protease family protein [Collinsella sp. AGMB00827]|uniref:Site-2 protease family protein n=1 Tax=Collinsella ureilytica TaxID=2869515 RepID=A0ABS7ML58_9ACTN|nr:site-2 protease family protein [Collinsella urealyticum]MBY4798032.1 site-2 protease family protein [Collinsella urealyticum]
MQGFLSSVFWGVLVLSILVFVHEGGHFLAARLMGVRVTEFFLGLPCRVRLSRKSSRIGTRFGVTPLLLGGYAAICGMDPEVPALAHEVLATIHTHGRVRVGTLAEELKATPEEIVEAASFLLGWGSIAEAEQKSDSTQEAELEFLSMSRDSAGNTVYDGRAFRREEATQEGEPWPVTQGAMAFFMAERAHTYLGKGFWPRAFMLVAGILVNIICGFAIMVFALSCLGTPQVLDSNVLGGVRPNSPAAEAGIQAGDVIQAVNDQPCSSWTDIVHALSSAQPGQTIKVSFEREGMSKEGQLTLDAEGRIGIEASVATVRLSPLDAMRATTISLARTAEGVARLIHPSHTVEVLQSSSSIVGISAMSAQAAVAGPAALLPFMALISFSLAFMNLLPIPPLDGGKLLIEIIQAVLRRPVSVRIQTYASYVGIGLFLLLFVFMLRTDILRLLT